MRLGIATIYQELDLVEGLSVAENVHLGHEPTAAGFVVRGKAAKASTAQLLRRLGHPEIDPARLVGELSAAQQQIVSMARALSHDVRLIVMDEPSAALDPDEVDNLFRIVGDLTADGVAVVYISHRLEEIRRIGDRVTVLKDGRAVAGGLPAKSTPTREVVALMTGRNVEYVFPQRPTRPPASEPVLRVQGLARAGEFEPSTSNCAPARSSAWPVSSAPGAPRSWRRSTGPASRQPVKSVSTAGRCGPAAYAPPSAPDSDSPRGAQGAGPADAGVRHPQCVGFLHVPLLARGWIDRSAERGAARAATRELSLRPDNPSVPIRTLSGGNQQRPSWPAGCCAAAASCSSTNPPAVSTSVPAPSCTRSSAASPTKASPYFWSPARFPKFWGWLTG